MAMRGLLRNFGGITAGLGKVPEPAAATVAALAEAAPLSAGERIALLDSLEATGLCWFWATDAKGRLTYLSPTALENLGCGSDILGQNLVVLAQVVTGADGAAPERPLSFYLGSHLRFADLPVVVALNDVSMCWSLTGRPFFDKQGQFCGFRGQAADITIDHEQQMAETRRAQYDALTNLPNRHRMGERLKQALAGCRAAKRSCALMMIDLDKFKLVNDKLGHQAGDELLREVAQRLQRVLPSPAEIGRLGGDEFQAFIPDLDDRGQLGEMAKRIIQMLSQPFMVDGARAVIGASVGIAIAPYDGIEPEELVKNADLALYAAKGGGRGQYRFFANGLAQDAAKQRELGLELADAIEQGQIDLHYQPVVKAIDSKVVAFEALLRWDHPELGAISPSKFLPMAQDADLEDQLCDWVLHRACCDAAKWPGSIAVAVNLSGSQFLSPALPEMIRSALDQSGLPGERLELELSESVFLGDSAAADAVFDQLKSLGLRLSLDDFGTGHASLGYLRRAPFDKIKIHRSFVRGSTDAASPNGAVITAIASLARALGVQTTAEGVEAMDELEIVRSIGVDMIQGFIYSRAVPQQDVLERLQSGEFHYQPSGPARQRAERRTVFRRIGVVHEDYQYQAMLRNISRTGALIEGLLDVPVGTQLVLDLGDGQLAVATVRRSQDATQGVEFETPLIDDGAGGLCTRHRVSPYALAAAGLPLTALQGEGQVSAGYGAAGGRRRFMQLDLGAASTRAA